MTNLSRRIWVAWLVLPALLLVHPSSARAEEMVCSPVAVVVDVKPGDSVNKINLSARGLLPVVVLSTPEFEAGSFAPEMAHLSDATAPMDCSGAAAVRWADADVKGDGLVDLVFFFRVQDLALSGDTTKVILMAHGTCGGEELHIMGTDAVIVKQ
jgi:hypothetical protein